jgi:hypothetical protein
LISAVAEERREALGCSPPFEQLGSLTRIRPDAAHTRAVYPTAAATPCPAAPCAEVSCVVCGSVSGGGESLQRIAA